MAFTNLYLAAESILIGQLFPADHRAHIQTIIMLQTYVPEPGFPDVNDLFSPGSPGFAYLITPAFRQPLARR